MLPEFHHEADRRWISSNLELIPSPTGRADICVKYSRKYKKHFDAESNPNRADGVARRAANTALRRYIVKRFGYFVEFIK